MFVFKMSQKKQIFKVNTLKKLLDNENSCVSLVPTTRLLALPPFFLNDMKSGILYLLNNMLKKYDRSLDGIVIGYQNIKVLMDENTGIIPMGTSETEVNISVEFYIFQPKIGSFLEGIVNKKSNSHIGCLVHKYFNATILKPEDIDYDKWICQDINVDDRIIFKVKDLDFTCLLPLIEGIIDDEKLTGKLKSNFSISFDLSSDIVNNVNMKCFDEALFPENTRKNKNDNEYVVKDNVSEISDDLNSIINSKKKKKKKEEEEIIISEESKIENHNEMEKNEGLDVKKFTSYTLCRDFKVNEKQCSKKKKKKDRRKQESGKSSQESSNLIEIFPRGDASNSCKTLEKLEPIELEDRNDFVKQNKIKVQKKKEKKSKAENPHAELNKTNQCHFSNEAEDEIFYSTQLDPFLPKKMKISCCSPVLKHTSFEENFQEQDSKSQAELNEKEKKQKHQKQKRKLGSIEDHTGSKKLRASYSCFSENEASKDKMNFDEGISVVQNVMEELSEKQVSRGINKADKECSKEWKKKKEMLNFTENKKSGTQEKEFELDSLLEKVRKQEIERVKEELNISVAESHKEIKKGKMKVKKKEEDSSKERTGENSFGLKKCATPLNGTYDDGKKFTVQNVMDHFLKEEMNRVKDKYDKSDLKRLKKEKKAKKAINNEEESSESKTDKTLYEKLLKEAKSAMDFEEDKSSISATAKELGKKSKVKSSVGKTDKNFQKTKSSLKTPEKYKNGSMYDAAFTPEKLNFEKSLFSDSEQSNASPTKKDKKMADSVAEITSQAVAKAVKNRSVKEKERRASNSEQERESLYEKLLSEAKSLIQSSSDCSLTKKKEKHLQGPKSKKNDCKTS